MRKAFFLKSSQFEFLKAKQLMRLTPALYYEKQNIKALAVTIKFKKAVKNKDNCRLAVNG